VKAVAFDDEATRTWVVTACFMLAVAAVLAPASLYDMRTLDGVGVWAKPLKFAVSLTLHFATLAVLAQFLSAETRRGRGMARLVAASVGFALFEIAYLAFQAARGRQSHFNFDTGFETGMYALMGVGATLLVAVPFVMGLWIMRQRDDDGSGVRLGAVLGLLLAPVLTMIVTGYMSGVVYSHSIGEAAGDAGGMPLLGWSRETGDLRPSHFVALHAIQILPLAGLLGDRFASGQARRIVWGAAALVIAATIFLFMQAVTGQPLWPR
jgi:hypothetical protein